MATPALRCCWCTGPRPRPHVGGPGDGPQYAIDQEVQDVQAGIAALPGERLVLVGHSYGAICALEAALREPRVQALSLYEPPLRDAASDEDMTAIAQARDALAAGRPEDALLLFYRLVLKLPEVAIDGLRAQANWTQRVQIAHTVPLEHPRPAAPGRTQPATLCPSDAPIGRRAARCADQGTDRPGAQWH
ncbi:hypothetical protein G6F57_019844 [Rhizopus arrhizus]|nr:hypothetical protein G6F57_019844 [Rhizopus arrhizus]